MRGRKERLIAARDARGWRWLDHLRQDFRYAARGLARDRSASLAIVITLALGLGATTAVYSLADRLFIQQPAGVVNPRGIRRLYLKTNWTEGQLTAIDHTFEMAAFFAVDSALEPRARSTAYFPPDTMAMSATGTTATINGSYVAPGYFSLVGVRAARGRLFAPAEMQMGRSEDAHVAVLSYALWEHRFGSDSAVIGRVVDIAHRPYTIVGIAARGFVGTDLNATDVWLPIASLPDHNFGGVPWYQYWRSGSPAVMLVRPDHGTPDAWLSAVATAVFRHGEVDHVLREPDSTATVLTGPLLEALGPSISPAPEVAIAARLAGVALIVLLIACANVANLLLVRAVRRRREIAVRLALGISRGRLMMQLVTESVLLASLGGAAALTTASWAGSALRAALMPGVRWAGGGVVDHRLLLFGAALALTTGVVAGLVPAIQASRPDLTVALKSGARDGGGTRSWLRGSLMLAQVSLSVMLLVGAGLFLQSLRSIRAIDLGYDMNRLVMGTVTWLNPDGTYTGPSARGRRPEMTARMPGVAERLQRLPGIDDVALASSIPMRGYAMLSLHFENGRDVPRLANRDPVAIAVTPSYFATTGLHVDRGRPLTDADVAGGPTVVVVNETAAQIYWPGRDPLGQCLRMFTATAACMTVVGVTRNAHLEDVVEGRRVVFYTSIAQVPLVGETTVIARAASGRRADAVASVKRALLDAFPDAQPPWVTTGEALIADQYRPWEIGTALFGVLGLLALAVAAVGVYSVIAYSVSQRTHEMGVRVALGAQARDVVVLVLRQGAAMLALGVLVGIVLALALARLVASFLYGVSPHDPAVLLGVAGLLFSIGLVATVVPAWRASRVDPMTALRVE